MTAKNNESEYRKAVAEAQRIVAACTRPRLPGEMLVSDELIAERRLEAVKEDYEGEAWCDAVDFGACLEKIGAKTDA